jgi:hypothetical protein
MVRAVERRAALVLAIPDPETSRRANMRRVPHRSAILCRASQRQGILHRETRHLEMQPLGM